jgi:hypothetical protein
MKKNLLYLLALVCSLTFFAACSSDDDDSDNKNNGNPPEEEAAITAPDVVGTYWGNLDISMIPDGSDQEIVIGDGIEKFITLSQVSNTEVKIELKEFSAALLFFDVKNFERFGIANRPFWWSPPKKIVPAWSQKNAIFHLFQKVNLKDFKSSAEDCTRIEDRAEPHF